MGEPVLPGPANEAHSALVLGSDNPGSTPADSCSAPRLAILATFEIAPGKVPEVLPLLLAHRDRCLAQEPGTLQLDILQPRAETGRLHAFEVYASLAAFKQHWEGASLARLKREADSLIVSWVEDRFELVSTADTSNGRRKPEFASNTANSETPADATHR